MSTSGRAGQAEPVAVGYGDAAAAPSTGPRLLAGWYETGAPTDYGSHLDAYGPPPIPAGPRRAGRDQLIGAVAAAGLRGRGGAGFPTGTKLRAVAAGRVGRRRVVVANGCEGEPASEKDRVLLTLCPHLVLDGVVLAAHAVGADEAVVCLHAGDPTARGVRAAIGERLRDPVRLRLVEVPDRYVASEESALVHYLNSGDPRPTTTPPRPSDAGVRGRPTLVDNVETLAQLALIARYGPDWFRTAGTPRSPGTTLVTVGGAVARPGVYEIGLGSSLGAALDASGGATVPLNAVLVGGYGGSWLPLPEATEIALTHEDLRAAGAGFGVALLVALPSTACGLATTAALLRFLAAQSARQCGPCTFGLPAITDDLTQLVTTPHEPAAVDRLTRRLGVIAGRGACAHPDGAVRLARSALSTFAVDLEAHRRGRPCRGATHPFPLPGLHPRRSPRATRPL